MTVAVQRKPWTLAIMERLSDGRWHNREDLIRHAQNFVPPERAAQAYRTQLQAQHTGKAPWRIKAQDTSDRIRDGRREVARRTLNSLIRERQVAQEERDGVMCVKLLRP